MDIFRKALLVVMVLLIASFCYASDSYWYDSFKGEWRYGEQGAELRWNPYEGGWSYEKPGSELRINPYDGKWDYKDEGDDYRYNPMEGRWE